MAHIPITASVSIDEQEVTETFVRASGPGGQHVNKTSTAVELRFDAAASPSLPDSWKQRLRAIAGQRMTRDGLVIITAEAHRSQWRNRQEALEKLVALLKEAGVRPAVRRPTRPTLASKTRRLQTKQRRSTLKSNRASNADHGD